MSGEMIAILAVGVALAGVIFAWKTSQVRRWSLWANLRFQPTAGERW